MPCPVVGDRWRGPGRAARTRFVDALDVELLARPAGDHERPAHRRSSSARTTRWFARERPRSADGRALSEEFVLADLQEARAALEEVTGRADARRCARAHLRAVLHRQVESRVAVTLRFDVIVVGAGTPAAKRRTPPRGSACTSGSARCRATPSRTCRAIRRSAARRRVIWFARSTRSAD